MVKLIHKLNLWKGKNCIFSVCQKRIKINGKFSRIEEENLLTSTAGGTFRAPVAGRQSRVSGAGHRNTEPGSRTAGIRELENS